ncbi:MAG: hypothetical protein IJP61_08470 [Treponema sp.]|nr:hypothetical protein [Treponema sp.]
MLRHKFARTAALLLCAAALVFSSCTTSPKPEPVNPLSLLGSDNALYIYVPVDSHKEFVTLALMKLMELRKADSEKITGRIKDLYIGTMLGSGFEISASGNFPPNYAKASLTEKNGWDTKKYLSYDYFVQNASAIEIAIPCPENVVLSYKVQELLDRFDKIRFSKDSESDSGNSSHKEMLSFLESSGSNDILFVSSKPDLFFYSLAGTKMSLGVDKIKGTFASLPDKKETYGVSLVLEMSDPRTIKACIRLLQMALFGIPAKIYQSGENKISVTDITMSWNEILDLISK